MDILDEARSNKSWHHDIKMIDGRWVEQIVEEYQHAPDGQAKDELLRKIIDNYAIFRTNWANAYSKFMDGDVEAGKIMHDEVVWHAAKKFNREKIKKPFGKAFNAYLVSGQLNTLKNMRNKKMSHKNHPRIQCPICSEEVYQIDEKHLRHSIDIERYRKMFPGYPTISLDGTVTPPWGGPPVSEISEALLNRSKEYLEALNANLDGTIPVGRYTMEDMRSEFPGLFERKDVACPMTGLRIRRLDASYPATLMDGYSEMDFVNDFPNFEGLVTCPISNEKKLEMTQCHIDEALKQTYSNKRASIRDFNRQYKWFTLKPKQVPVLNPYTGKMVMEITHEALRLAGTNVKDHLARHATIVLNRKYDMPVHCPFTGKALRSVTKEYLDKIGRSVHEFYQAVCKYPLRKWQVRNAIDGSWVDNVWSFLSDTKQRYAQAISMQDFEQSYGKTTRAFVSTNSYTENDEGESMHVADLLVLKKVDNSPLEIEDSLLSVSNDDMDRKIVASIRAAHTIEDLFYSSSETSTVQLDNPFQYGMTKELREEIKGKTGEVDFDISIPPKPGEYEVVVMVPSRDTIRKRLSRMMAASDLNK